MFFLFFLFYSVFLAASLIENDWDHFDYSQLKKIKPSKFLETIRLKKIITFHELYLDFDYQDEKIDDKNNITKYGFYLKKQIEQTAGFYERVHQNISEKGKEKLKNYLLFLSKEIVDNAIELGFSIFALFPLYSIAQKDKQFKKKIAHFVDCITYKNRQSPGLHKIPIEVPIKIKISQCTKKIEDSNISQMIKNIDVNNFYKNNPREDPQQKLIDLYKKMLEEFSGSINSSNQNSTLEKIKELPCLISSSYEYQYPKNFLDSLKKQVEKSCNAIENCINNSKNFESLDQCIDSFMNGVNKEEERAPLFIQEFPLDKIKKLFLNNQIVNVQYDLKNMKFYSSVSGDILYLKDKDGIIYSVSKTKIKRNGLIKLIKYGHRNYSETRKINGPSAFWSRLFCYTVIFYFPLAMAVITYSVKKIPEQEDIKKLYQLPLFGYLCGASTMFFLYIFFPKIKLDLYSLIT